MSLNILKQPALVFFKFNPLLSLIHFWLLFQFLISILDNNFFLIKQVFFNFSFQFSRTSYFSKLNEIFYLHLSIYLSILSIYLLICLSAYLSINLSIYLSIYLSICLQRERERDRQTDRQTERDRFRDRNRETKRNYKLTRLAVIVKKEIVNFQGRFEQISTEAVLTF